MKTTLLILAFVLTRSALASITVQAECEPASGQCQSIPVLNGGEDFSADPNELLILEVSQARLALKDPMNESIFVMLDAPSTVEFANFTERHLNKRVAVIVNGRVLMAPTVVQRIPGPEIRISLGMGQMEANSAEDKIAICRAIHPDCEIRSQSRFSTLN